MNLKAIHLLKHLDIQLYDRKYIFSKLLDAIRENLTNDQITQNVKHDLQKTLAWFIIDYFSHNNDFIEQTEKIFDHKVQMTKLYLQNNQTMYGTPNGLMNYLSIYQQIYHVRQLALFLLIKIMLEYIHLQLTQHL